MVFELSAGWTNTCCVFETPTLLVKLTRQEISCAKKAIRRNRTLWHCTMMKKCCAPNKRGPRANRKWKKIVPYYCDGQNFQFVSYKTKSKQLNLHPFYYFLNCFIVLVLGCFVVLFLALLFHQCCCWIILIYLKPS